MEYPDWVQETSNWLVEQTLIGTPADRMLKGFCERLVEGGIPLVRGHIACGYLHPMFRAFSVTWNREEGIVRDRFSFQSASNEAWLRSPLKAVTETEANELRFRLKDGEGIKKFPVLAEFKERGFTDYIVLVRPFSAPPQQALARMDGCISSWVTDGEEGFSDKCMRALQRLFPRLAVALKTIVREQTAQNIASAYLGNHAGDRVLRGSIRRGDGETIQAAIWFSDMRGSTAIADIMEPRLFLNRLNRYFECTAGSVLDHGGEVLRFIGDAVLAIFPIYGPGGAEKAARVAVSAAKEAMRRAEIINRDPPEEDPTPIEFGLGLHIGEVLYGNIGVPERLEFSVIGRAANESARLQDLTKLHDTKIIASDAFVSLAPGSHWKSLGSHSLRGVSEPQPIWAFDGNGTGAFG